MRPPRDSSSKRMVLFLRATTEDQRGMSSAVSLAASGVRAVWRGVRSAAEQLVCQLSLASLPEGFHAGVQVAA
jgi:hypothetical protein